jgi:hypothetical protein
MPYLNSITYSAPIVMLNENIFHFYKNKKLGVLKKFTNIFFHSQKIKNIYTKCVRTDVLFLKKYLIMKTAYIF